MYPFAKGTLALLAGAALGWFMLAGFCSIPGIAFSTACGHNAFIWLPLFIPLGIWLCWRLLGLVLVDPKAKSESGRERVIDLTPAVLDRIEHRGTALVLVFPRQPCYSDAVGVAPMRVPCFACELQIEAATLESGSVSFPLASEEWQLEFKGGARGSLLPVGFQAEGPVRLTFGDSHANQFVITGRSVRFSVGAKVGEEQAWPAT